LKKILEDDRVPLAGFEQFFVDPQSRIPLEFISQDQMKECTLAYRTEFERQTIQTQYEAEVMLFHQ